MCGCGEDDLRILIAKKFIIPFDNGICVIRHWRVHNYIQRDRYQETVYSEEFKRLNIVENGVYELDTKCIQNVSNVDTQVRLGKVRIGKVKPPLPPKGELFGLFWKSYPKRVGKGAAEKAFKKINPSKEALHQMLEAIEKAKKSDQWKKDGGQFIPYPATWLNQKRWEDEVEIEVDDGYVTLWDGSARVPRYQCIKTERGWEEKSRIGEPSHLKGE
jgi:hypothetical protein